MTKIKYCVWDMGGVLYEWSAKPFYDWCFENTQNLDEMKKNIDDLNFDIHMSGLEDEAAFAKRLCDCYYIPYKQGIEKEIAKVMLDGDGSNFEVSKNIMKSLMEQGIENALLSNAFPSFSNSWRNDNLMKPENRFFSFELGLVKPDLRIYEKVRKKLGIKFEEMIFIDDKIQNVEAAKSLGVHSIVFNPETIVQDINKVLSIS